MPDPTIPAQQQPVIRLYNAFMKYGPAQEISAQDVMDYIDSRFRKILLVILGSTSRKSRVLWWKYLRLELEVAMSMVGSASIKGLRFTIPIVLRCLVLSMAAVLDPEPTVDDDFVAMLQASPPFGHPAAIVGKYAHSWWTLDLDKTDVPDPTQAGQILPGTMTRSTIQMCLTVHWKQQPFLDAFPDSVPAKQWYTWGRGTYIPPHENNPLPQCDKCVAYKSVNSTLYERVVALEHRVDSTQTLQKCRRGMSLNRAMNLFRVWEVSAAKCDDSNPEHAGDELDPPDGSEPAQGDRGDNTVEPSLRGSMNLLNHESECARNIDANTQPQPSTQADIADVTLLATPDPAQSPQHCHSPSSHKSEASSVPITSQNRRWFGEGTLNLGEIHDALRCRRPTKGSDVAYAADFNILPTGSMGDMLSPPSQPSSLSRASVTSEFLNMKQNHEILPLPDDRLPHHFDYPPLGADRTKPTQRDLPWIMSRETSPSEVEVPTPTSPVHSIAESADSETIALWDMAAKAALVGNEPIDHPRDLPGRFDRMSIKARQGRSAAPIRSSSTMDPADVVMRPPDKQYAPEGVNEEHETLQSWDDAMTYNGLTNTASSASSFRPVTLLSTYAQNVSSQLQNAPNEKGVHGLPFRPVTLNPPKQDISSTSSFRPVALTVPTSANHTFSLQPVMWSRPDEIAPPATAVEPTTLEDPRVPTSSLRSTPHTVSAPNRSTSLQGPTASSPAPGFRPIILAEPDRPSTTVAQEHTVLKSGRFLPSTLHKIPAPLFSRGASAELGNNAAPNVIPVMSVQPMALTSRPNGSPMPLFRPLMLSHPKGATASALSDGLTMSGITDDTTAENIVPSTMFRPVTLAAPTISPKHLQSSHPVTLGARIVGSTTGPSIVPAPSFHPVVSTAPHIDKGPPPSLMLASAPPAAPIPLFRPPMFSNPNVSPVPMASGTVALNPAPSPVFRPVTLAGHTPSFQPNMLASPSKSPDNLNSLPRGGSRPFSPMILQNVDGVDGRLSVHPPLRYLPQDDPMDLSLDQDHNNSQDTFGLE